MHALKLPDTGHGRAAVASGTISLLYLLSLFQHLVSFSTSLPAVDHTGSQYVTTEASIYGTCARRGEVIQFELPQTISSCHWACAFVRCLVLLKLCHSAMAAVSGRAHVACALLLLLLLVLGVATAADPNQEQVPWSPAPAPSPMNPIDCGSACAARCALSSRPNLCHRACGSCCARCHCVPPGTSGNHHVCPCYAAITTRGGRPKCP